MQSVLWYIFAAACEIGGCYAVWMWLRLGRTAWWLVPAVLILIAFAVALTRVDTAFAGRTFAAYGGVYIVSALAWLAIVRAHDAASIGRDRRRRLSHRRCNHFLRRSMDSGVASRSTGQRNSTRITRLQLLWPVAAPGAATPAREASSTREPVQRGRAASPDRLSASSSPRRMLLAMWRARVV